MGKFNESIQMIEDVSSDLRKFTEKINEISSDLEFATAVLKGKLEKHKSTTFAESGLEAIKKYRQEPKRNTENS